jgi:serine/threonine protein kinase
VVVTRTTTGTVVRWEAPSAESLADVFPGLKIKALCGVGGMGAVYRAEQIRLGRAVAVKVLPLLEAPDLEARERFEREARILSGLNHPHVLHIHDFGALPDGTLYIVTEWAGGGDLAKKLNNQSHPLDQVQAWVRQIAEALMATHSHGVIHRDLKPGNVLVFEDGRISLADFGLAHATGAFAAPITGTGAIFGTYEYMAPEQMESAGNVTPATDLYALGVITYQMITGRVPRGSYTRPSRLAKVPSEVDAFFDSALAADADRRPASAADFVLRFERACNAPRRRRQRQVIELGVAVVILALAWSRTEVILAESRANRAEETVRPSHTPESRVPTVRTSQPGTHALGPVPQALIADKLIDGADEVGDPEFVSLFVFDPITSSLPILSASSSSGTVGAQAAEPLSAVTPPPAPDSALATVGESGTASNSAAPGNVPWTWLLPDLQIAAQTFSGEWRMEGGELVSDDSRCALSLPVGGAINYDIAVEFTRRSGRNSVVLFLPTLSGVGTLEVDASEGGIAGLQLIDGENMRAQKKFFPANLVNGEQHRLVVEVRGDQVSATWDGEPRITWALSGHRLSIPRIWKIRPEIGLGVGSWSSSTTFHRIAYRALPAKLKP